MLVLVLAIGLHEYGHAKFADMAGDPTPRMMGRVTLNPIKHLDPIGTIFMVISSITGFGIGWGKPVMVRPERMNNPRWDHFVSVLAGPMMNFLQAVFFAIVLRGMTSTGVLPADWLQTLGPNGIGILALFLYMGVFINVALMLFNLIPLGPLDGHWLVGTFMPEPMRLAWYQFNRGIGAFLFLALVLIPSGSEFDILGRFLFPAVRTVVRFMLGGPV